VRTGVNVNTANLASLHTSPNCVMPDNRKQSGYVLLRQLSSIQWLNIQIGRPRRQIVMRGTVLNQVGGGWFVMKRTQEEGVQIWFWDRNDWDVPFEIASGLAVLTPEVFRSQPDASFPSTCTCNFDEHFDAHTIVFDTTLNSSRVIGLVMSTKWTAVVQATVHVKIVSDSLKYILVY